MDTKNYFVVDSVEKLEEAIARTRTAQQEFSCFSQEQVDRIFLAAASAANKARLPLAKMAVEETDMGIVEDISSVNIDSSDVNRSLISSTACPIFPPIYKSYISSS